MKGKKIFPQLLSLENEANRKSFNDQRATKIILAQVFTNSRIIQHRIHQQELSQAFL